MTPPTLYLPRPERRPQISLSGLLFAVTLVEKVARRASLCQRVIVCEGEYCSQVVNLVSEHSVEKVLNACPHDVQAQLRDLYQPRQESLVDESYLANPDRQPAIRLQIQAWCERESDV